MTKDSDKMRSDAQNMKPNWAAPVKKFEAILQAAKRRKNADPVTLREYESILEALRLTLEQLNAVQQKVAESQAADDQLEAYTQRLERASEEERKKQSSAEAVVEFNERTKTDAQWPGLFWRVLIRDWQSPQKNVHDIKGDGSSWFDELVVGDWFHMEWMHGRCWWLRLGDASIFVTVPKGKPPVLQIKRGVYHPCPSQEEDEQVLSETDPDDDAFAPKDPTREY
jgi:hypothetical protein